MQRRRILGLAMIGIGLIWLTSNFGGGHSRGRGWEDDWEANMENWEENMERDMEKWEANMERHWEDGEKVGAMEMPPVPVIPEMPAMPEMPPMAHFEGHSHWFGWWKLPLLLIGAMLLLTMRRRRMVNGENYNATVHRF